LRAIARFGESRLLKQQGLEFSAAMGIYQPGHKTAPEQQIIIFFDAFRLARRRNAAYAFILSVDKKHRLGAPWHCR
jgi:hypothetical protein